MTETGENMSVMIVDDDEVSAGLLTKIIEDYIVDLKIQGVYNKPELAIKALREKIPHIVFLDVDMPGLNGIDLVKLMPPGIEKNIIYITGHEKYAIDALKLGVSDYLLKPISAAILVQAIDKVKAKVQFEIFELRQKLKDKLLINKTDKAVLIDINDILYMQASGPYTHFVMSDKSVIKSSKSLGYYLKLLSDKKNLQRVNRSFVVNFDHIKEIIKGAGGEGRLVMTNDESIIFSSAIKNLLIQNIQDLVSKTVRG